MAEHAHEPWLPTPDDELSSWLDNFAAQLTTHGATFDFIPAEIAYFNKAAAYFSFIVTDLDQARADVTAKTSARDTLLHGDPTIATVFSAFTPVGVIPPTSPAGLIPAIYAAVTKIKNKTGVYSDTWGDLFRIIGAAKTFVPTTYEGNLKVDVFSDHCLLKFMKKGAAGAAFFRLINDDVSFTDIIHVTESPWKDMTPLRVLNTPEKRKYYAMGTQHDKIIGHPSPIITVTFGGPPS